MNKIKCIYAIKDKRSDKVIYIGQTSNFEQRMNNHFKEKRRPIDLFLFEQGRVNFEMFILEKLNEDISKEEMKNKEQYYIDEFNTYYNGLNKNKSGNITLDMKEYQREYKKEYCNTDKYRDYQREYQKKYCNTDKYREYKKEYCNTDKYRDYQREKQRQYRLKKKQEKLNQTIL